MIIDGHNANIKKLLQKCTLVLSCVSQQIIHTIGKLQDQFGLQPKVATINLRQPQFSLSVFSCFRNLHLASKPHDPVTNVILFRLTLPKLGGQFSC